MFSYQSFSNHFPLPRHWTRDRDIGPATATLDPRPRLWTRDRDIGPATRDPRLLVKLCRLGWFKTSQALRSAVRLNSSKDNFIAKSFRLPTERKLSILLNFLFPFVSYRRIFNLEMQNFSLENHHMNACQPFCWWITFTKVSNPFLPSPPKWLTWPLDDCGGVGGGWFYWFSLYWRRFFSQTSLELEIFSPTYNGVRFIFQHCTSWAIFFSVQDNLHPELFGACRGER